MEADLRAIDMTVADYGTKRAAEAVEGLAKSLKEETEANHRVIHTLVVERQKSMELQKELEKKKKLIEKMEEKTTAVALRPTKYVSDVTNIRGYLARFKVYARASNIKDDDWANVDLLMSYLDTRALKRVLRMELDKNNMGAEEAMVVIVKELEDAGCQPQVEGES